MPAADLDGARLVRGAYTHVRVAAYIRGEMRIEPLPW